MQVQLSFLKVYAVTVSIFTELFSHAATVSLLPELILHKYSVVKTQCIPFMFTVFVYRLRLPFLLPLHLPLPFTFLPFYLFYLFTFLPFLPFYLLPYYLFTFLPFYLFPFTFYLYL